MINNRLVQIYTEWVASGSPQQEGTNWTSTRTKWLTSFSRDSEFIKSLPISIDRSYLRGVCASKDLCIRERFLAVMVWGYGDRAYGPYRVGQMFIQPNTENLLEQTFALAESKNPIQAYDFLRLNKIDYLGPSYASKFISFSTPRSVSAPIFDSLIAAWLANYATKDFECFSITSQTWNVRTYSKYVSWIQDHALHLNAYPDDIELVIFREAVKGFSKNSSWSNK